MAHKAIVICATNTYITIEEFKKVFEEAATIAKVNQLVKTIFDKRAPKVFHQPSMQWYFVEWKEKLFGYGITKHVKILPDDFVLRSSVKLGRAKIDAQFPYALYHKTQILYKDSIEDALKA